MNMPGFGKRPRLRELGGSRAPEKGFGCELGPGELIEADLSPAVLWEKHRI